MTREASKLTGALVPASMRPRGRILRPRGPRVVPLGVTGALFLAASTESSEVVEPTAALTTTIEPAEADEPAETNSMAPETTEPEPTAPKPETVVACDVEPEIMTTAVLGCPTKAAE